ncbi:hypothetical protein ACIQWB_35245 [Streptomyces olivaceus]|uniref:hypothetical protein n=1 Tax=Streptomyces olivaceus TaxID=47716 RepID=UPI003815C179
MTDDFTDADAQTLCDRLGIETKTVIVDGQPRVVIDETGMRKLADHAPIGATAAHAMVDQATAAMRDHARHLNRIRTDVVTLLTARATRPLNADEQALVATATRAELQAAADQAARLIDEDTAYIASLNRIRELAAPYFAKLPDGATFGDVMAIMPPAERAELDAIAATLPIDGDIIVDPDA